MLAASAAHQSEVGLASMCARALIIVVDCDAGRDAFFSAGGAGVIVAAMKVHGSRPAVVECCDVLGRASLHEEHAAAIFQAGGAAVLLGALRAHRSSQRTVSASALALSNICRNDRDTRAVLDAGGASAIVAALDEHASDIKVMEHCCYALRNMTSLWDDGCAFVITAGGAAAVTRGLRTLGSDNGVAREAIQVLLSLVSAAPRPATVAIAAVGGVAALMSAHHAHWGDVNVTKPSLSILGVMCRHEESVPFMLDVGGLPMLLELAERHAAADPDYFAHVMAALRNAHERLRLHAATTSPLDTGEDDGDTASRSSADETPGDAARGSGEAAEGSGEVTGDGSDAGSAQGGAVGSDRAE